MSIIVIRAKLIIGGNQQKRLDFAQETIKKHLGRLEHPDLLTVEADPSVSIAQVREIKKNLSRKPYSASVKIIFIPEAEKITYPAQNALLKTLEEPPGEALILLSAPKKEALLPTIISRCQIIRLREVEMKIDDSSISQYLNISISILNSGVGERLQIAEQYSQNREQAIDFCQKQLAVWRGILRGQIPQIVKTSGVGTVPRTQCGAGECYPPRWENLTPSQITTTLHRLHQALIYLEAKVNPRLIVENLLLGYPKIYSKV